MRQLFDTLDARGLLDDAVILITADHGERMVGGTGHGGQIDLATGLVPLLVYDGRGASWPKAGSGLTSQTDAAPTLLAAAGIQIPHQWKGSALQFGVNRSAAPIDTEHQSGLIGRVDGQFVLVRCNLRTGRLSVLTANDPLSKKAIAAYPQWAPNQIQRKDSAHCVNHARP